MSVAFGVAIPQQPVTQRPLLLRAFLECRELSIHDERRRTQGDFFFPFFLSEQHLKGDFAGERRAAAVWYVLYFQSQRKS